MSSYPSVLESNLEGKKFRCFLRDSTYTYVVFERLLSYVLNNIFIIKMRFMKGHVLLLSLLIQFGFCI